MIKKVCKIIFLGLFFLSLSSLAAFKSLACILGRPVEPVVYNYSPSVPMGFYFLKPGTPLTHDSYVRFYHPTRTISLLKRVAALPGDYVEITDKVFKVRQKGEEEKVLGGKRLYTSDGERLREYRFAGVVPEGWVFVYGEHEASYDSRYFGPVEMERVSGYGEL